MLFTYFIYLLFVVRGLVNLAMFWRILDTGLAFLGVAFRICELRKEYLMVTERMVSANAVSGTIVTWVVRKETGSLRFGFGLSLDHYSLSQAEIQKV